MISYDAAQEGTRQIGRMEGRSGSIRRAPLCIGKLCLSGTHRPGEDTRDRTENRRIKQQLALESPAPNGIAAGKRAMLQLVSRLPRQDSSPHFLRHPDRSESMRGASRLPRAFLPLDRRCTEAGYGNRIDSAAGTLAASQYSLELPAGHRGTTSCMIWNNVFDRTGKTGSYRLGSAGPGWIRRYSGKSVGKTYLNLRNSGFPASGPLVMMPRST